MKKILLIAIGLVMLTKLIDFVFYGRQLNDLAGALGFAMLLVGAMMPDRQSINALGTRATSTGRSLIGIAGITIVAVHLLVKWKILGA